MKKIFFIHSKNKGKAGRISKEDILIFLDRHIPDNLDNKHNINLDEYAKEFFTKKGKTRFGYNIDFLQKWAFTKTDGKKSFVEEMVFENFSLWYQLEFFFLCDVDYQLGYELSIPGITWYIDLINDILDKNHGSEVVVENRKDQINKIIIKVCEERKALIKIIGITGDKKSLSDKLTHNSSVLDAYIRMRILLRRIVGTFFAKKYSKGRILILTSDRLSNKKNVDDYFWGPIIRELDKKSQATYKVVEYDRIEALQSISNLINRYVPQRYDSQFIGTYYDRNTIAHYSKIRAFLKEKFLALSDKKHFQDGFKYKNIKFYDIIEPRLKKIFLGFPSYIADTYAISKSVMEKEKPEIVVVDHEKNYYGRALITYAHLKRIPSICLEGEIVYDTNTYLTHIPIKRINDISSPIWRPLPEKKLLWGEVNKRWHAIKNQIPEDKLEVIGAPKYDFLKTLDDSTKSRIRKAYSIEDGEKLVIIITVLLPIEEKYIKACLSSLKSAGKVHVIIKMHLTDPLGNKEKLEKILKSVKIKGDVVINENTSELIYASDLVTSYPSTIVYECILLNKKVIILGDKNDLSQPYVKEGLIKLNTAIPEFKAEINAALGKDTAMNLQLREKFIKKYLFSDDGKSSKRAVDIIERMME